MARSRGKRGPGRGTARSSTRPQPEEKRAVSEDIARDVTYALSNVVEQGTGSTVRTLDRPVAGKTGTKDVEDDITSRPGSSPTPRRSPPR